MWSGFIKIKKLIIDLTEIKLNLNKIWLNNGTGKPEKKPVPLYAYDRVLGSPSNAIAYHASTNLLQNFNLKFIIILIKLNLITKI